MSALQARAFLLTRTQLRGARARLVLRYAVHRLDQPSEYRNGTMN